MPFHDIRVTNNVVFCLGCWRGFKSCPWHWYVHWHLKLFDLSLFDLSLFDLLLFDLLLFDLSLYCKSARWEKNAQLVSYSKASLSQWYFYRILKKRKKLFLYCLYRISCDAESFSWRWRKGNENCMEWWWNQVKLNTIINYRVFYIFQANINFWIKICKLHVMYSFFYH